jgi:hypothetical protein
MNRTLENPIARRNLYESASYEKSLRLLFSISAEKEESVPSGELFLHAPSAAASLQATVTLR